MKNDHEQTSTAFINDAELLRRFVLDSDEDAFAQIVRRHQRLVRGVCRRVIGCEADIDDAFQATFLQLARRPSSVRKASSLSGWLYTVAWRASIRFVKQRQRLSEVSLTSDPETKHQDALQHIASQQNVKVLDEELNALPVKYRDVLVMTYFAGQSSQQIAEQLKLSKGTVDGRLRQARNMLRVRLARRGVGITALGVALTFQPSAVDAAISDPLIDSTIEIGSQAMNGTLPSSELITKLDLLVRPETMMTTAKLMIPLAVCLVAIAGAARMNAQTEGEGSATSLSAAIEAVQADEDADVEGGLETIEAATVEVTSMEVVTDNTQKPAMLVPDEKRNLKIPIEGVSEVELKHRDRLTLVHENRIMSVNDFDSDVLKIGPVVNRPDQLSVEVVGDGSTRICITDEHGNVSLLNVSKPPELKVVAAPGPPALSPATVFSNRAFKPYPPNASPRRQWMEAVLDQTIPSLDFPGETSLKEILDTIQAWATMTYGYDDIALTIYPDVAELEAEGVNSLEDVIIKDIELQRISLRDALALIFEQTVDPGLTYVFENGVMKITSLAKAESTLRIQVYEVGEILKQLDLLPKTDAGGQANTPLVDLVKSMVAPILIWQEVEPGAGGSIQVAGSKLIVSQTSQGHKMITELLNALSNSVADTDAVKQ